MLVNMKAPISIMKYFYGHNKKYCIIGFRIKISRMKSKKIDFFFLIVKSMWKHLRTCVRHATPLGWPETKADLPIKLTPYFHTRDEYTVQYGLVFKGDRAVIPVSLRKEMKEAVHSSHRN